MDKSWIHLNDRSDVRYMDGIKEFIMFAMQHRQGSKCYKCPCRKCLNSKYADVDVMSQHLYMHGMMWSYTTWSEHGEVVKYNSGQNFSSGYNYQGDSTCGSGEPFSNPDGIGAHGSGSCKIINIAKVHRDANSKHPHLDAAVFAYYRPGREEDIASQRVVLLKQMASKVVTQAQSQNPDIPIDELSPLSLETEISIADTIFGCGAGKEVRGSNDN